MERPLQIAFKDMESSEFLEALIRERVDRLERFHPRITGCRVVVNIPHRSSETGKTAIGIAVEVDVPGHKAIVVRGEDERREMKNDTAAVVNRVFETVQRQLEAANDIRTGEVKQHESAGETGTVIRLFPEQDYGFIEVRGAPDLYFTRSAVANGDFDELETGMLVQITRAAGEGPMGPQASSVKRLNALRSAS